MEPTGNAQETKMFLHVTSPLAFSNINVVYQVNNATAYSVNETGTPGQMIEAM